MADPWRTSATHRGTVVSNQIQRLEGLESGGDEAGGRILHCPAVRRPPLDHARRHEDRHGLPPQRAYANARVTRARPGVRQAEALMKRFGLSPADLLGLRFAINVALATVIVW